MGIAGCRNGRAQSQDMGRAWHILEQPNKRVEDQAGTQFVKSFAYPAEEFKLNGTGSQGSM